MEHGKIIHGNKLMVRPRSGSIFVSKLAAIAEEESDTSTESEENEGAESNSSDQETEVIPFNQIRCYFHAWDSQRQKRKHDLSYICNQ